MRNGLPLLYLLAVQSKTCLISNVLGGSQALRFRHPLTDHGPFDILQSGPGWEGIECNSPT